LDFGAQLPASGPPTFSRLRELRRPSFAGCERSASPTPGGRAAEVVTDPEPTPTGVYGFCRNPTQKYNNKRGPEWNYQFSREPDNNFY